jgi:hypothetical protein
MKFALFIPALISIGLALPADTTKDDASIVSRKGAEWVSGYQDSNNFCHVT